jgi:hypothetical protein
LSLPFSSRLSRDNPQHWHKRADEARATAAQITDPEVKKAMLDIAKSYERIAMRAAGRTPGSSRDQRKPVHRHR